MIGVDELNGARIFLVEDEPLIAALLEDIVVDAGGRVAGVAASLPDALAAAAVVQADAAVLDINLDGRMSYPAAEALLARGVPLLFVTGYAHENPPARLAHVPVLAKPYVAAEIVAAVAGLLAAREAA